MGMNDSLLMIYVSDVCCCSCSFVFLVVPLFLGFGFGFVMVVFFLNGFLFFLFTLLLLYQVNECEFTFVPLVFGLACMSRMLSVSFLFLHPISFSSTQQIKVRTIPNFWFQPKTYTKLSFA